MTLELITRVLLILLGAVVLNGLVRFGIRRIMRGGKGLELSETEMCWNVCRRCFCGIGAINWLWDGIKRFFWDFFCNEVRIKANF